MTTVNPAISKSEIANTLAKIKSLSGNPQVSSIPPGKVDAPSRFQEILSVAKNSLSEINATQNEAEVVKTAYMKGDPNVSLSKVLISSVQSKVAFEGLLVVRNKLIDAYKEVMNMPV